MFNLIDILPDEQQKDVKEITDLVNKFNKDLTVLLQPSLYEENPKFFQRMVLTACGMIAATFIEKLAKMYKVKQSEFIKMFFKIVKDALILRNRHV